MISHDKAVELAKAFSVLTGYPEFPEALEAVAELLGEICATEEQADWLYREVCLSGRYTRWGGPGWLRDIWAGEFGPRWPAYQPPAVEADSGPVCESCQSLGHHFDFNSEEHVRCFCIHGQALEQKFLDLLNGKRERQKPMPRRFAGVAFTPITAEDIEAARQEVEENFRKVNKRDVQ